MNNKISVIFISCLIFWLIFAPKSAIIPDTTISGWISNSISLFLMGYVCLDYKNIFKERYRTFNLLLLTYLIISVYSVYYNAGTIKKYELEDIENSPQGITSVKYLFFYSIGVFASSLYVQRISNTKYIRTLLNTFVILFLIVLIPAYIEVIITPIEKGVLTDYSFGNKFTLGYYHLFLCTSYYLIHPRLDNIKHLLILSAFLLLMMLSSIISQCSTMILGAFIFMLFSLFVSDAMRSYLASAKSVVISLLVFDIGFFFFVTWILQYDFVQYFVQEILNRDITLTGRLSIYMDIQEAFFDSPWIGLGYGNSIVVSKFYTDAYDSQNGLVELFLQIGVIGVAVFLLLLYTAAKTSEENKAPKYPLVAFIYTIIGISTVEIPFKHTFIFFLSFCFIRRKRFSKVLLKLIIQRIKQIILAKKNHMNNSTHKKSSVMTPSINT